LPVRASRHSNVSAKKFAPLRSPPYQSLLGVPTVYDHRFAREYGPWRPVIAQVADKFLACGVLAHGFARIRCDACAHEYLLAFSCRFGPPPAELRGRSPRVSDVPRAHADHRMHHPGVGDRPASHASPGRR